MVSSGCRGKNELKLLEARSPRRVIEPADIERMCVGPLGEGAWEWAGVGWGDVAMGIIDTVEVAADDINDGPLGSGRMGIDGLVSLPIPLRLKPVPECDDDRGCNTRLGGISRS